MADEPFSSIPDRSLRRLNYGFDVFVFLLQQAPISGVDEVLQPDASGDQYVGAEQRIGHHGDRFFIHPVAAHAAHDRLFAEDNVGQVERRRFVEYAHEHYSAASTRQPSSQKGSSRDAGALHHQIEALAGRQLIAAFLGIFRRGIHNIFRAAEPRCLSPALGDFKCHHARAAEDRFTAAEELRKELSKLRQKFPAVGEPDLAVWRA